MIIKDLKNLSNENLVKGNQFLNIQYPISINEADKNNILDNDFFSSKVIFTCDFENEGMLVDLQIENNNFVQNKKMFNKKKYTKSIPSLVNNVDDELMKSVIQINDISEEMNKITDMRLKRKIKEEEKKEEFINDLNKKELIKILSIESKLNQMMTLSLDLQMVIEKIKKELFN